MGSVFKEYKTGIVPNLQSTGKAGVSGPIARILDEDAVQIEVSAWDREKKALATRKVEVNLSELGGVDPSEIKKDLRLTVIGNIDNDNVIHAKKMDMGNCFLELDGFYIAAGEFKFKEKPSFDKTKNIIDASIKIYDPENDRFITVHFPLNSYGADTKKQDMAKRALDYQANANHLEILGKFNNYPWEGIPFDSCIVGKIDDKPSKQTGIPHNAIKIYTPEEGVNAGQTFYSIFEYGAYPMTSECIGTPIMEEYNKMKEYQAQYAENHATVKTDTEVNKTPTEAEAGDTPFAVDEPSYEE